MKTKIFIGGSMSVRALSPEVRTRLDNIIASQHHVLVGDAPGVDALVQTYFASRQYTNVTVYHSGNQCRHNVGNNPTISVAFSGTGGRAFYTAKDIQMANDADFGFMLWDGRSQGTKSNLLALTRQHKKALLWLSGEFFTISSSADIPL